MNNTDSVMTTILGILLAIAVLTTVGTIMYHLMKSSYETETAILADADESVVFQGVYIRTESVLNNSANGTIAYEVPDGGKVAVGDTIAEIYPSSEDIALQNQISNLQSQVDRLENISNPGTTQKAQPLDLAEEIYNSYKSILQDKEDGDLTALEADCEDYTDTSSTYQIVINQGEDTYSDRISELNTEIERLQGQLNEPIGDVEAKSSGYFVSYTDGFENILTPEKLDLITEDTLNQAIASDNTHEEKSGVLGKSITGYTWYMMGIFDNSTLKYEVDNKVTLRLLSSGTSVTATITDLQDSAEGDGKQIVVLECNTMDEDLVAYRTEPVEMVLGEYEGIKVPRSAIRFADVEEPVTNADGEEVEGETETVNCRGVYIMNGEQVEFRKLDVIYEGTDYILSSRNAGDGYLNLYDSIIVEGIDADGN